MLHTAWAAADVDVDVSHRCTLPSALPAACADPRGLNATVYT